MKLILDTGNVEEIKEVNDILVIDGVTTNPSIVSKEKIEFEKLIEEISKVIDKDTPIHAQVISTKYDDIIKEAEYINNIRKNIYVKIPVTKHGLKAIKYLSTKDINITATAIFTAHQGYLAAKAGAKFVAPYVNRIDNISGNGVETVRDLVNIIDKYKYKTEVLAASFKNAQQVLELMKVGVHAVTVPYDILCNMINHPSTDLSINKFIHDWEEVYGNGKTTL